MDEVISTETERLCLDVDGSWRYSRFNRNLDAWELDPLVIGTHLVRGWPGSSIFDPRKSLLWTFVPEKCKQAPGGRVWMCFDHRQYDDADVDYTLMLFIKNQTQHPTDRDFYLVSHWWSPGFHVVLSRDEDEHVYERLITDLAIECLLTGAVSYRFVQQKICSLYEARRALAWRMRQKIEHR